MSVTRSPCGAMVVACALPPWAAATSANAPAAGSNQDSLPAAEQTAIGKCDSIEQDFSNKVDNGPLAGIQAISNSIYNDLRKNKSITNATKAWNTCMARNGYHVTDPRSAAFDAIETAHGATPGQGAKQLVVGGTSVTPAQNETQIATAVTDANCTQSADLAGIYFAVEASYEQQIVSANSQALATAVQQYRADYRREVGELPKLLSTTKAVPAPKKVKQSGGTARG